MSSDNAIVVGKFLVNGTPLFSVVETAALDNFDYYRGEGKEYDYYVYDVMGQGQFFLDESAALKKAHIYENSMRTEYGVKQMDFTDVMPTGKMISFVENRNKKIPMKPPIPPIHEPMETMGIFKGLKAACIEETTEQTQLWMIYKVHGMWSRREITDNQMVVLIDEILT